MKRREKLEKLLADSLGVSDKTSVEYILSLAEQGVGKLKKELADFPPELIKQVIDITQAQEPSNLTSFVGSQCSGKVVAIENGRAIVNISEPQTLANKHSSVPCLDSQIHINSRIWGHIVSVNPIEIELAPITLTETVKSRNVTVDRKVPKFSENEFIGSIHHPSLFTSASIPSASTSQSWFSKAAKHTTSKSIEYSKENETATAVESSHSKVKKRRREKSFNDKTVSGKKELPVHAFKDAILDAVSQSPVIIIVGDTGSGKTTQLTQFLHDADFVSPGRAIACTQPRRSAAISIAERVATEMQALPVGGKVGYAVRFDDTTSDQTIIKYMTDGLLLRELMSDPDLSRYSVIMLDEAHERTIATDVLFALLKSASARRPDLRILVTSATLDAERFSKYFDCAPILRIPGRTYPVEIEYLDEPISDYMEAAISSVKRIHETKVNPGEEGDILVFLTGQAEIEQAAHILGKMYPQGDLYAVPVYAAIPSEMQSLIFDPAPKGKRKVVLATNIAETSLTIDGIRYVVDPGFVKVQVWDARKGMSVLRVQAISQAQANQRSGRAGRTAPGVCYRLYTKTSFHDEMPQATAPEIQRVNLDHTVLLLKSMGIDNILEFDFMDPPPRDALVASLEELYLSEAIDDAANITDIGRHMAAYPSDPALAKVVVIAKEKGSHVLSDISTIIAMLSMPSVFYRPSKKAEQKDALRAHEELKDGTGDHLTLLNVYQKWLTSNNNRKWCTENFIHHKTLLQVKEALKQLKEIVGGITKDEQIHNARYDVGTHNKKEEILKILCAGFFQNTAKLQSNNQYMTLNNNVQVSIHPSSVLFKKEPPYVSYTTLTLTSKEYMHVVSGVQPEWLVSVAPHFYKFEKNDEAIKRQKSETIRPSYNRFSTHPDDWRVSKQRKTLGTSKR